MPVKVCAYLIYLKNKYFFQPMAKKNICSVEKYFSPLWPMFLLFALLVVMRHPSFRYSMGGKR